MTKPFTYPVYGKPREKPRELYRASYTLPELRQRLRSAESETHQAPSEAQKRAGNYPKGLFHYRGLEVSIENPAGSVRSGKSRAGVEWSVTMPYAYGYLRRTMAKDGDQVDVFLGPHLDSDVVFGVDQVDPKSGAYDETKWFLGWKSKDAAKAAYLASYSPGWQGFLAITAMTWEQFRTWLAEGDQTKPIHKQATEKYARKPAVGQKSLWHEEDHPRGQPDNAGEFVEKERGPSPLEARQQVIAQALQTMSGLEAEKAAELAKKLGARWDLGEITAFMGEHGADLGSASEISKGLVAALHAHYKGQGREFPVEESRFRELPPEEEEARRRRSSEEWNREKEEKRTAAVAFAREHYKEPPPAEQCTFNQWSAMAILKRIDELEPDAKKLAEVQRRIDELDDLWRKKDHEAYYTADKELAKLMDKPAMRKLAQKYPFPWNAERARLNPRNKEFYRVGCQEAAKVVPDMLKELKDRVETADLNYWNDGKDATTWNPAREHLEAIKAATAAGKEISDENLAEHYYEDWMPKSYAEKWKGKEIQRDWQRYVDGKTHKFLMEELGAAMRHAEPQLKELTSRIEASYPQEVDAAQTERDRAEHFAKTSDLDLEKKQQQWRDAVKAGDPGVPELNRELQDLKDEVMKNSHRLCLADHALAMAKKEGAKRWHDAILPNDGGQIEIGTSEHLSERTKAHIAKAQAFLAKAISAKFGKITCGVKPTDPIHYGGTRAYQSQGNMHLTADEATWVVVHEFGHRLEHIAGEALAQFSKSFAANRIQKAGQKVEHLGAGYEPWEFAAKDELIDSYAGKFYDYWGSEVLSMGLQNLYQDPVAFYKRAPEHFKYTLAAIHGLLT